MKKLLKLGYFILFVTVLSVIPCTAAKADTGTYEDEYGNVWKYESDNTFDLTGTTYMVGPASPTAVSGSAIVPSDINGVAVTTVGGTAGWYSTQITSITIPSSVIYIGDMAFTGWSNLEAVNFEGGSNLKVILKEAFSGCSKLSSITIPASVQEIGVRDGYPDKETGYSIFGSCTGLMDIQVEAGNGCFKSVDGVLYSYDGSVLYAYPAGKSGTSYEIPADVVNINSEAFYYNNNLTSITFASGSQLTTIGDYVFGHSKIASFSEFPASLVNFGDWDFGDTEWIRSRVNAANPYLIINGVLLNAYYSLTAPTSVILPDGITTINDQVFSNAIFAGNTTVTIPASVTTIDKNAFYSKADIVNIIFPENSNLISIGTNAFGYSPSITTLKLPDSLITLSDSAFGNMAGLKSIAIPNSVVNIGDKILYGDTALEYVYTDNELIKSSVLHESWNTYNYTFAPYDSYNKEAISGTVMISGPELLGATLSAITFGITNTNPGAFTYAWYWVNPATGDEVSGVLSTGNIYTVSTADIGYKIRLKVSSANCNGTLTAETGIIPKADCPSANVPTSGSVNNSGTNKTFTFTGVVGVTYEYSINNGSTWSTVPALTGTAGQNATGTISLGNVAIAAGSLKVRAKETSGYKASSVISNEAAYTASLEGSVGITGTLRYNETLTATAAGSQSGASLIYTWYRSGSSTPIKTGSSNQYKTVAADVGKTISVKVTASGYTGNLEAAAAAAIVKADAVITIAAGKDSYNKTYGDADFYLEGITNSINGVITYSSSDTNGLTVTADGKIHIKKASGVAYTVTAALAGTDCYNAASKSIVINVLPAMSISLSLSNLSQTSNNISVPTVTMVPYSKAAYDKIKVEYGVVSGSAITWSGTLPTTTGSYKVRASLSKADINSDTNLHTVLDEITTGVKDFIITQYTAPDSGNSTGGDNQGSNPGSNPGTTGPGAPVTTNPDGSKTQTSTVTNPDGSTTEKTTTINTDGSKIIKEATSNTTTDKDGSTKIIESVKETTTSADGTTVTLSTDITTNIKSDGSSTSQSTITSDADASTATMTVYTDKDGKVTSSAALVTAGSSEINITGKTAEVAVDINQAILNAVAVPDRSTDVAFIITADITKAAITDSNTESVKVDVNVPAVENIKVNGVILSKEVAGTAAENKKDLTITVTDKNSENYTVKIKAGNLDSISKDIILSLSSSSYKDAAKDNKKLASAVNSVIKSTSTDITELKVVNFSEDKALGTGVALTYNVSDIKGITAGDKVYVYLYNSKTNKLEEVANNVKTVSKSGTITTSTLSGGNFIVSAEKLTGDNVLKLVGKVTAKADKTTLMAGDKTTLKVTLPEDIKSVSSFNKKSDPVGQEEAQITFKVSDQSIAGIDANGNITAKKPGKVQVTVTVKLENGQKKEIVKTIEITK